MEGTLRKLQARLQKATASKDDDSEKSSVNSSVKHVKKSDLRNEAEIDDFPAVPSVPHYATWLDIVLRQVMDGSGSPIEAIEWWAELSRNIFEELADSGKIIVRCDLRIGTGSFKRAQGHLRSHEIKHA